MLTDVLYAMKQVRMARERVVDGAQDDGTLDCLSRAMDALERLQEAAQQAEQDAADDAELAAEDRDAEQAELEQLFG